MLIMLSNQEVSYEKVHRHCVILQDSDLGVLSVSTDREVVQHVVVKKTCEFKAIRKHAKAHRYLSLINLNSTRSTN